MSDLMRRRAMGDIAPDKGARQDRWAVWDLVWRICGIRKAGRRH